VLLHVLDASKTGLGGVSRKAASEIAEFAPDRTIVVVDACQLRCPAERLRSDLQRGFMVLTTGSKFAGGPPFSGALLLPEAILDRLRHAAPLPKGFEHYSTQHDWPETLQSSLARDLRFANVGLGLRWAAALAELKNLAAVDGAVQAAILSKFAAEVIRRSRGCPFASALEDCGHIAGTPSIVPLVPHKPSGKICSSAEAAKLHVDLRTPFQAASDGPRRALERIVHVGQPVAVGNRSALRMCASASQVVSVAQRLGEGGTMEEAFRGITCDLDDAFAKWSLLMESGDLGQ
jgi:hypothetical protein